MNNAKNLSLFATCPKGLELLLVDELVSFGATQVAEKLAGVSFMGDLEVAYRACLWSRLANRILLPLDKAPVTTPEDLYRAIQVIQWHQHMHVDNTLAVHVVCSQSTITHTLFAAQKVKDAIVDQLREKYGKRPNVDMVRPDISVNVYLHKDVASISLDLSGESLHKRGYRLAGGVAPLKENLAAALLLRARWPEIAERGGALMDPMCGSGTLLLEGALMAGHIAPALSRDYMGFLGWKQHDDHLWQKLKAEAETEAALGVKNLPPIIGYDQDSDAIAIAFDNIERAGLRGMVHVEKRELADFAPRATIKPGLVVTNPPYGERIGEVAELQPLYTELGTRMKAAFEGWSGAVFTGNPDLGKQMGLRAKRQYALANGALPCKLLLFDITKTWFVDRSEAAEAARRERHSLRSKRIK